MLLNALPTFNRNISTLIGLTAVIFWSTNVGLMRSVSESFGAVAGAALIYSVASMILVFMVGMPKFSTIPKSYLWWGSLLFVAYELCFALSIGYAQNSRQAIEVGMINYLWPTFTLLFAIIFNNVKANILIIPGCIFALVGICWVLGGDTGFDFFQIFTNLKANPLSYGLAFAAAILWAAYCSVTVKTSQGKNLVTIFFALTGVVLWIKYLLMSGSALNFTYDNTVTLIMAAGALGLGYGAWNIGIISGNMTLMAGASYFIPVLSALFAALILSTSLSFIFWQGVAMVTAGAVLCWLATRKKQII
ncbi:MULTISPECIES: aromatic amino acid DMT transporter YddG [Acinetobacter]|jgi:drug/metabolite transporter (DMT)-like permease|uniref:Aromatic amino acid exporter YddG n=7 Tax=Acinetobacter TaxID=469 RepID=A0A075M961_ACIPI|nr:MULTISPECIES: aromatic amino acid DMT transporter YddG [Acinetobacter]AMO42596.1 aromatic amino acid transporter [Acinetobacter sp. DUT-2]KCY60721.1 inner membrane protein yddG [Acinetobacter baumannii 1288284]AIF77124.1 Permease of the drug/metabolite transporter(DMT) superfamily [Acinetobacter pittii]AJB50083.1 aromatic amino acid exporter [Acinetobacter nosocomialis]AUT32568.1 drug/metabolite DMT transporter permease [Acinetobacter pittii]